MSTMRVYRLITLTWVFSVGHFFVTIALTVRMQLCRKIIEKIYCANYSVVKLACEDISAISTFVLIAMIYSTCPQLLLIVYSYAEILKVCLKASKESQAKALNTCTSHIMTLVNYSFGGFYELIQNRFDMSSVPHAVQIMLSVHFIIFPPLINPIIYGVRTKSIKRRIQRKVYNHIIICMFFRWLLSNQSQITMQNSTHITIFLLTAYGENGNMKYLYFAATLLGYLLILLANAVVIAVITFDRQLHEPMYIFICNLSLNGLYGSSAFYPMCMANLLSEIPTISRAGCLIQIFSLHTYGGFEYSVLALMAYDRYLSICHPLRYNSIMTPFKVTQLLVFVYMYPICIFSIHLCLTVRLPLCGSVIDKVHCDNWSVVKLSCVDITVNSVFGLFVTTVLLVPPILLSLYSYVRILAVCLNASKEARSKALQTCAPHLLTFINYCITSCFEVVYQRFEMAKLPHSVLVIMSINCLLSPPLLNPITYGIKLQEIRKRILKLFSSTINNSVARVKRTEIKRRQTT
ncbi:O52D1 protein, partial [Amia calva]|nr:O52D1 protein [Amia calva]